MRLKGRLEIKAVNDEYNRIPPLEELVEIINSSSVGFNLTVVHHESLYDYNFDTKESTYNVIDSRQVVGHVESAVVENDEIYLILDLDTDFDVEQEFIIIPRASLKSTPGSDSIVFDEINIFCIDIITIGDTEDINPDNLTTLEFI